MSRTTHCPKNPGDFLDSRLTTAYSEEVLFAPNQLERPVRGLSLPETPDRPTHSQRRCSGKFTTDTPSCQEGSDEDDEGGGSNPITPGVPCRQHGGQSGPDHR